MENITKDNIKEEIIDNDDNIDEYIEEKDEEEIISDDIIPIEDIYKQNIGALSLLNNLKEDADNRFKERKLSFAKNIGALRIIIIAIISAIIFHYRTDINGAITNYTNNVGLILKSFATTINITVRNLHIITFLYFTHILPLIFDLFIIFIIDILDLFIFIISRFDYHIGLKGRKIEQLLKNKKNNKDNNSGKDYIIIIINGILYVLIMGMLIPINLIIKGTSVIAKLTEGIYNFILPQNEIIKKIQPSINIKKSQQLSNTADKLAEGKNIVKQKEQKRSFFNNLIDKIKKYYDNIIDKNDLLTNSLKDNKTKITNKTPGRKRITEKGGRSLAGKSRGRNRNESQSTERNRDTKEPKTRDDRDQIANNNTITDKKPEKEIEESRKIIDNKYQVYKESSDRQTETERKIETTRETREIAKETPEPARIPTKQPELSQRNSIIDAFRPKEQPKLTQEQQDNIISNLSKEAIWAVEEKFGVPIDNDPFIGNPKNGVLVSDLEPKPIAKPVEKPSEEMSMEDMDMEALFNMESSNEDIGNIKNNSESKFTQKRTEIARNELTETAKSQNIDSIKSNKKSNVSHNLLGF